MTSTDNDNRIFGNRYAIKRRIARGGMADVFLAQDNLLDRPVALKVLFPELSVDPSFVERFRREAQNAARLSHPNIVSVYDWGEEEKTYYIVMEYVDGQSLATELREHGALVPQRAAIVGAEVAAALSFAHRNGVIHRDVKPGNVLIDSRGAVKVTDFGIARARNTTENLTQTGAVMGTATYFSPEQAQGHAVDPRSDVYSLGVVLYEIVAGRPPFQGDNPVTIAYKHVREEPAPLRQLKSSVPPDYVAIVSHAMAKAPESRYGSAEELRADLERFSHGQPISATTTTSQARNAGGRAVYADSTRTIPSVPPTQGRPAAAPPKSSKGVVGPLLVFLSLLAALAIGAIVLFNTDFGGSSSNKVVQIPNVVGMSKTDALNALKNAGLRSTTSTEANSATVDQVVSQDPVQGQGHQNDLVRLVLSSGPAPVTLTDYTGQTATDAKKALQKLGFQVTTQSETSDVYSSGKVTRQDPQGGTQVAAGSTVTLWMSTGAGQIQVPQVTGYTVSVAASTLSNLGLHIAGVDGASPDALVEDQNPDPGSMIAKGGTVNVTVSDSSQTTTTTSTTSTTTPSKNGNNGSNH